MTKVRNAPKASKARGTGGLDAYSRLVLDPCHGPFTQTNLPGSAGGQQVRCPFRQIVTVPSSTQSITGAAITGGVVSNTLFGCLTPHAMVPGSGPPALSISSQGSETAAFSAAPGANYCLGADPVGLSSMAAIAGEMRPVAACIRISCLSQDTSNGGLFFGYEGANRQFLNHGGDDTQPYYPYVSAQQIILTGGLTTTNTFGVYESKINYPNADATWQEFRQTTGTQSAATGVARSGDASDADWSEMPIAIAGVTSAIPGAQYLFDGAIVYEWQPRVTLGIDTPAKRPSNPTALQKTARSLSSVAKSMGGMLVNIAADYASGGSATAVNHMLRTGFAQMTAGSRQPMIGW